MTAAVLVTVLAVFFQRTRIGRALRAVADDHEAALSIGIPLKTIWVVVWSVAGLVAIVAGVMWGAKSGVQFSLSLIALKALPVLILGGFTSVPGAIVGGLIIGVGEKLGEVYWGPLVGGAIENWFAYVVALALPRLPAPGPLRREDHRAGRGGERVIYREAGQFKTTYASDQAIFPIVQDRWVVGALVVVAFVCVPLVANEYWLQAILIPFLVYSLAAIGLNLLTGYAGQLSLGTGGFMAVGATRRSSSPPAFPGSTSSSSSWLAGVVRAAAVGLLFGIPSLRIKGFYLAVATLAAQFFLIWLFNKVRLVRRTTRRRARSPRRRAPCSA